MIIRSKIARFVTFAFLVLICFGAWSYWPEDEDTSEDWDTADTSGTQNQILPKSIPAYEDLDKVLSGGEGEDHSWALETADRIARERIDLSSEDVEKLMAFIGGDKPASLDAGEWQHRVNSVLNALLAQNAYNSDLGGLLMNMATENKDPVLRLYALQHLGPWVAREKDPGKKQEIVALLSRLATKDGEQTAGTAIQMITELERAGTSVSPVNLKAIEKAALKIAADPKASHDLRVNAFHTCCERKLSGVLKDARNIAGNKDEITIVRKAAIYSIGMMGTKEDLDMLNDLSSESDLLAEAVKPAVKRIESRLKE